MESVPFSEPVTSFTVEEELQSTSGHLFSKSTKKYNHNKLSFDSSMNDYGTKWRSFRIGIALKSDIECKQIQLRRAHNKAVCTFHCYIPNEMRYCSVCKHEQDVLLKTFYTKGE